MNKTNAIILLAVLVVILLFVNFFDFYQTPQLSYDEMTAWQLLDVKIDYDNQIQTLKDERQEVIDLYNIKRGRVNTGTTDTGNTNKASEDTKVEVSTNIEWNDLGL